MAKRSARMRGSPVKAHAFKKNPLFGWTVCSDSDAEDWVLVPCASDWKPSETTASTSAGEDEESEEGGKLKSDSEEPTGVEAPKIGEAVPPPGVAEKRASKKKELSRATRKALWKEAEKEREQLEAASAAGLESRVEGLSGEGKLAKAPRGRNRRGGKDNK